MAYGGSSSSSFEDDDDEIDREVFQPPTKRGIGRGRGLLVEGEGPSTSSGRGRGRGRGVQRGKRKVTSAVRIAEEEAERIQHLRADRDRRADELVDELSHEGSKVIIKKIAKMMPSVLLDVAEQVHQERQGEPAPPSPEPGTAPSWPSWCVCHHCIEMPTIASRVCCGMRPDLCHSTMPAMELVITDPAVLQVQQLYRNDLFARHAHTAEDFNKSMRHAAYRQYILVQYGRLGQHVRRPVPSCCTWFIRTKYPDPNGHYVEYQPGW